jgi:hypothetical protein
MKEVASPWACFDYVRNQEQDGFRNTQMHFNQVGRLLHDRLGVISPTLSAFGRAWLMGKIQKSYEFN